jgi:hypothetical protein
VVFQHVLELLIIRTIHHSSAAAKKWASPLTAVLRGWLAALPGQQVSCEKPGFLLALTAETGFFARRLTSRVN